MQTKKYLVFGALALSSALLLTGCTQNNDNSPTAKPSSTSSTPAPTSSAETGKTVNVMTTDQYTSPQAIYSQFATNGEIALGTKEPKYLYPAFYTADTYIKDAFNNPYLFSGQWQTDDYDLSWANDNKMYQLLSEEYSAKLQAAVSKAKSEKNSDAIENLIFVPDKTLGKLETCTPNVKSLVGYCTSVDNSIVDASYNYKSSEDIELKVVVSVNPIYQKSDSPEGNSVTQARQYTFNFKMKYANPPKSKETKTPIMIITDMNASLDIQGVQDFSVNEE
jgi:hypothetical protein